MLFKNRNNFTETSTKTLKLPITALGLNEIIERTVENLVVVVLSQSDML